MQRKCYGSTVVSKTISVGSTPTFCDFMKGFTMTEQGLICLLYFFLISAIIGVLAMFFSIALDVVPIWISSIKNFIDELKRINKR